MLDKELLKLIGGNKKYIAYVVVLSVIGLLANLAITASICYAVSLAMRAADGTLESYVSFAYPAIIALVAIVVRYVITRLTGHFREKLSREVKKDLREKTYNKILSLGVKSTDGMNMAYAGCHGRRRTTRLVLLGIPSAILLCDDRAVYSVFRMRGDRLESGGCIDCVRTRHSHFYRCGVEIR